MKKASREEKELVVNMLSQSFDSNQSVNYIVNQDARRKERIRGLMDYSFEICNMFGEVLLSDDRKACALIVYPDQKKSTLKSSLLDAKLALQCVGLANIKRTLDREALIKKIQPQELMTYLWFIGVAPADQGNGIGSQFLQSIIQSSTQKKRPIYLETSTVRNLPWYQKHGFDIYNEHDLSYRLYFLKRECNE